MALSLQSNFLREGMEVVCVELGSVRVLSLSSVSWVTPRLVGSSEMVDGKIILLTLSECNQGLNEICHEFIYLLKHVHLLFHF